MTQIEELERKITAKIVQIKQNKISPADSKIGLLFKLLKPLDEALNEKLMNEYIIVFKSLKK